jgi:HEAT repeat protein
MERYALAEGLAAYPAAGMEPIFTRWLDRQDFYEYALLALYHLNTPQARAILAQRAAGVSAKLLPTEKNAERWLAVEYLSWMGDRSYLPLLEKLVHDPARDVQRMAVFGIARLGREKDLQLLTQLAREGKTTQDRIDPVQAIGETGSLKAVPVLIDLFTLPNADQPSAANAALYELTHHEINEAYRSDAARAQQLWQAWWTQNQATARAYPPVNCDF